MTVLKTRLLGDICKTNTKSYSYNDAWEYVNYLDTGNITSNSIDNIQYINLSDEKLPSRAKRKVKFNSIIYSTVRPNQCHYGIIKDFPDNFLVSTGFTVIDVDNSIADADYIFYWLTQSAVTERLHAIAEQSASAYPSIKPSDLEGLEIELPSLEVQKKISSILMSLENKMDCNTRINRNLMKQGISIVRKISEMAASRKSLNDICYEITAGGTPSRKRSEYWEPNDYTWFKNGEIKNNILIDSDEHISKVGFKGSSAKLIPANAILFAMYCVSKPQLAININECTTNQAVCALIIHDFDVMCYVYFYMMEFGITLTNLANGAAQQNLNKGMIQEFLIDFPNREDIKSTPLADQVKYMMVLARENKELIKLRDTLLPKLMSGEFDVTDLQI